MKRNAFILASVVLFLAGGLFSGCQKTEISELDVQSELTLKKIDLEGQVSGVTEMPLVINGGKKNGNVTVGILNFEELDSAPIDGNTDALRVTIQLNAGITMGSVKYGIQTDLSGFQYSGQGQINVSSLDGSIALANESSCTFILDLNEEVSDPDVPVTRYVAVMAETSEGTAWGYAFKSPFFVIVTKELEDEPITEQITTYAYFAAKATPLSDYFANNWGWSNGPFEAGEYDLILRHGNSGNPQTVDVGNLHLVFDGTKATATISGDDGYEFVNAQVYIGTERYPLDAKGKPTAPGQFQNAGQEVGNALIQFVDGFDTDDEVYIIAKVEFSYEVE